MGALDFDPYAMLAEIQKRNPTPATVPTPPTLGPKTPVLVTTVGTVGGVDGVDLQISKSVEAADRPLRSTDGDPDVYLAHLQEHGFRPYGAVATALGWGATRAWQAEARLRASGRIVQGEKGLRLAALPENAGGDQE